MDSHLSEIVSQVPSIIKLSKRARDPTSDICSQFFNFDEYYEGEPSSPGTRTRSVTCSDPGLTSGPSEVDGASSPGPGEDIFQSEVTIKQVKQHDDRFTVPEREIRPKGLQYPSKIHLDNVPSPTGSSPTSHTVMILSNPGSPPMHDASITLQRGRRTQPLDQQNRQKAAFMRNLGACFRCRERKVTVSVKNTISDFDLNAHAV